MDFTQVYRELNGVPERLLEIDRSVGRPWETQNNLMDNQTRYIYGYATLIEVENIDAYQQAENRLKQYAAHRWFNNKTSCVAERIFAQFGATSARFRDNYLLKFDILINEERFDVKMTNYPLMSTRNFARNLNLEKRNEKDMLIRQLYNAQSDEQRADENGRVNNRLTIVCDCCIDAGQRDYIFNNDQILLEQNKLRMDFDQLEVKISAYMNYLRTNNYEFNTVNLGDNQTVYADIIRLTPMGRNIKQRITNEVCPRCGGSMAVNVVDYPMFKGNFIFKCQNRCGYYENI